MYYSGRIRCWRVVSAAICGIALLLAHGTALASPDDAWDSRFNLNGTSTSGYTMAFANDGSHLYMGGSFTSVFDVTVNNVARFDGATWSALGSGMNNNVRALAVIGSDVYAAGDFTLAGGGSANYIAKWNGTSWSALGSGMNNTVYALAVIGTDLYAGGFFTTAGGVSANRVAKWDGTSWSALGSGMNDFVGSLAGLGSDLYAGGYFTTAGGAAASYIARWDGSTWAPVASGMDSRVISLASDGSLLYASGSFTTAGGTPVNYIARWNGSVWSGLGSGLGNGGTLGVVGSSLYVIGTIGSAGGMPPVNVVRWDGTSWSALGSGVLPSAGSSFVNAIGGLGADVYVGGPFDSAGGVPARGLARWNGSSWSIASATPGNGALRPTSVFVNYPRVEALEPNGGGGVFMGGLFEFAGPLVANEIASWDGASWSALDSGVAPLDYYNGVNALARAGSDLYIGGTFSSAGGTPASNIARWNGTSWSALGTGVDGVVTALARDGSDLYVAGSFSSAGGGAASNIARWDGATWSALGSGTNNIVSALAVYDGNLYAGGNFTTAGGGAANYLARWNGSTWSAVGSGMDNAVDALHVAGGYLYVGGEFGTASGVAAPAVARWDGASFSALGNSGLFCNFCRPIISELATIGTDLYVGGNFERIGTVTASSVAKWNGATWSALGSGIPISGIYGSYAVHAMTAVGTDVYVGGNFDTAGGKAAGYVSVWHTCGNGIVDPLEECDDGNTVSGDCCSSTCQIETGNNPCPDDGNPCTTDQCDGSGGCAHVPNSLPCDDGFFCNGADVCSGTTCSLHAGNPCPGPDGDANCSESCDEATDSCTAPDPNGSACDDGLFCNGSDTCSGGTCTGHSGDPCPGPNGNANCSESCNEATDSCTAPDPNGSPCADGLFCNGADTCSGGVCSVHAGNPCVGGPECAHVCNEAADNCFDLSGTACAADTNPCTLDQCNGSGTCAHPAGNAGAICRGSAGQCDVAETCSGTSTACPADAFQPNGTPCNDGNACTSGDTCTNGTCAGGPPTVCPLCDTCTPGGGCATAPRPDCKLPTAPGKALLALKNKTPDTGDNIGFKWGPGAATTLAELGDPLTSNDYALCVYAGVGDALIFRGTAPAGGMCGGLACWSPLGTHGFKYGDVDLTPDGTMKVQLKSGLAGKAKASFKGKGGNLSSGLVGLPAPPFALPLRAQLQAGNGTCFEADFSGTPIKNAAGLFKAKGD